MIPAAARRGPFGARANAQPGRSGLYLVAYYDSVAPRFLGAIHGGVRDTQHRLHVICVIREYPDAYRYGDGADQPALVLDPELLDALPECLRPMQHRSVRSLRHDQNEL